MYSEEKKNTLEFDEKLTLQGMFFKDDARQHQFTCDCIATRQVVRHCHTSYILFVL